MHFEPARTRADEIAAEIKARARAVLAGDLKVVREFDPNEPRDEGGKWTDGGGGGDAGAGDKEKPEKPGDEPTPTAAADAARQLTANVIKSETPAGTHKANSRKVPDIAREVNARANAIWKSLGVASGKVEEPNPKTDAIIATAFAHEIRDGLTNGHADQDWYDKKMKEAMAIATAIHPEIAAEPDKKFAFTVALAITSQGQRVKTSAVLTEEAYAAFAKTGKFPEDLKVNKPSINANFAKLNHLIDSMGGVANAAAFLNRRMPAGDLQAIMNGRQPGSEGASKDKFKLKGINVDTPVYGSAIFGPKIGEGFYQNLNGNFGPVTMDMWFMRTWGRLAGSGIGGPAPDWERLTAALQAEGKPVPRTEAKLLDVARKIKKTNDRAFAKGEKTADEKTELEHAAERVVLAKDNGMVEQPGGGNKRQWMTAVFLSAIDKLKDEGINITPAAAQATIWNPEKVMYAHLGARVPEEADYAKVLRAIADAKGVAV